MGKLSFKLSHVMPYAWFYKSKDIGTATNDHHISQSDGNSSVHKRATARRRDGRSPRTTCTSPINHKAIAIRFPVLTSKPKVSRNHGVSSTVSHLQAWTTSHHLSASPSVLNLPSDRPDLASFNHDRGGMMDSRADEQYVRDHSSVSEATVGWKNEFRLDVRELERRLKGLASEERRKYYVSPMFSCALPTPLLDEAPNSQDNVDWPLAADSSDDAFGEVEFSTSTEIIYEDSMFCDDDRGSNSSSSFKQSSFSSGAGFERHSNSVWDTNDFHALGSDEKNFLATIDEIDTSMPRPSAKSQMKKQQERKEHRSKTNVKATCDSPSFVVDNLEFSYGIQKVSHDLPREPEASRVLKRHEDNSSDTMNASSTTVLSTKGCDYSGATDTGVDMERHSSKKTTLRDAKEKTREPQAFQKSSNCCKVFDSFAIVKFSYNPHQDFKDSMIEMILEKELHSSNDLVELMHCYLSLNAVKHHDTIVKVFSEVWSDLFQGN